MRSFAPNLAAWRYNAINIEVGIRIKVPSDLIGTFKTLENKATHGKGFKRSIINVRATLTV